MSIRLRLTLLCSGIVALTVMVLGGALYWTSERADYNVLAAGLTSEANVLTATREFRVDRIILPAGRLTASTTLVQTRDLDGQLSDHTPNLGNAVLPLSPQNLDAVRNGAIVFERVVVDGEPLLVRTSAVTIRGRPVGILQVARSTSDQVQALARLRDSLIVGALAVTILAFGIGYLLSGAVLRPLKRITQTAQAIGAEQNFDHRVSYAGPRDEIGELALTFNAMLAELQAAYQQVEHALQAQRRFVGDASHELRTPLTTVKGNIALLQRQPPIAVEDRVGALTDMADETDRLIRLVNNLLVLARVDAGQQIQLEPVPLKPLVEEVGRVARLLDPERVVRYDNLHDEIVVANADSVKQVLLILLDNALKHTPATSPVEVALSVKGDAAALSVSDWGPGIAPAALPHIFERFYRGDSARSGTGTGLGLAIAKTLVEAQHGSLAVESAVGQGSTFTVTLPRAHAPLDVTASEPGADAVGDPRAARERLPVTTGVQS